MNTQFFDPTSPRPTKAQAREARRLLKQAKMNTRHGVGKLTPKNAVQADYLKELNENDLIFAIGPAGVGKTYIPSRWAIEKLLNNEIEKVIITRPMVEVSGERIGFLPGDIKEKCAAWGIPIYDAMIDSIGSKQKLDQLIDSGKVEFAPFMNIRGRTFSDAVVIADESQNLTIEQWKVLVTRMGEGTKLIVTGDPDQSDLRGPNGLDYAIEIADRYELFCCIFEFDASDVVRSSMTQEWVTAFEKHKNNK